MALGSVNLLRHLADGLTIARLGLAVALLFSAWMLDLTLVALLVSLAWITDLFDGRAARASGRLGAMGSWDLRADTAVGACLALGLGGSGWAPPWVLAIAGALAIAFLYGSFAAAMLLQLCGYVPLALVLWSERPSAWWLPFVTVVLIAAFGWRRLVHVNIPGFLRDLRVVAPRRRQ